MTDKNYVLKKALFCERKDAGKVICKLCNHNCTISPGKRGICAVRENIDGTLYSLNYGRIVAANVDPIEKKPLFHFLPGSDSFSIASAGCNFRCAHCQNYHIAQLQRKTKKNKNLKEYGAEIPGKRSTPEKIVEATIKSGCKSIAYTYTEPTIYFEFALETAKLAKAKGLKNIFVSNGYTGEDAVMSISPYLDGNNIDLKSFSNEHYNEICGAKLQPVLDTIWLMKSLGVWLEITTLIIPGHNDSDDELRNIAEFIVSVDPDIPWHVSRFYPVYKMAELSPTPSKTLMHARSIGQKAGLRYVYIGNLPGETGEDTECPSCGQVIIKRIGYSIEQNNVKDGCCSHCKNPIAGLWI